MLVKDIYFVEWGENTALCNGPYFSNSTKVAEW